MEELIIRGILASIAPFACSSSTKISTFSGLKRYAVVIQAYAAPVYVKLVKAGGTDPSPSATDYHFPIPAGSSYPIKIGKDIDVYVQSAGNCSALEVTA